MADQQGRANDAKQDKQHGRSSVLHAQVLIVSTFLAQQEIY